jgi:WD40 repeat protein/serine/threonine protein kinase
MNDDNPSAADPLGLIADEFVEAFRQGKRPSVEEFARRYPAQADEIRDMLPALALMEKAKAADDPPEPRRQPSGAAAAPLRQLGDYLILREVGRGGMGVVYEAQQLSLGRHVAIKVLPAHALLDPRHLGRFRREARSAARLHHTNIVPVFGVGEHEGLHYYVMQFIHGLGLDAVLDELRRLRQPAGKPAPTRDCAAGRPTDGSRDVSAVDVARGLLTGDYRPPNPSSAVMTAPGGPAAPAEVEAPASARAADTSAAIHLPGQTEGSTLSQSGSQYWQSVARVGVQVADALAHAAGQGVLHRDIKPSNLLLDDTGNVWVTDFGLAKADSDGDNLTHTGDIIGTLRYLAPERFSGQGDVRSDVYSLGLTLYELLALRPAFDESDRNKLVKQVMHDEPVRPRKVNPAVPRDLETVILKAVARDPAHRYQTPADMSEDLKRFVEDRPVKARRVSEAEKFRRWCRRNPLVASLLAAIVLVFLAGFAGVAWQWRVAETARADEMRQRGRAEEEATRANEQKRLAEANLAKAQQAEKEATEQRNRADRAAEVAQQKLYLEQMHLVQEAWRERRDLPRMRELLGHWLPQGDLPDHRGWEWFYLNSLPYQNLRTLTERGISSEGRSTVAWHVARKRLAAGTADGLIRIWDVDREQETLILRGPYPVARVTAWEVRWLGWSPDGGKLAAGYKDGTVRVWETGSGRELHVLRGHQSPVWSVAFSSDGARVAAWGQDGTIKLWDANTGRLTANVAHPGGVTAGAWSPDDTFLASGHGDGTVTISGTHAGDKIVTLRGHVDAIYGLAWSPDGARLASTSGDSTTRIWAVASAKMVLGPLRHSHPFTSIAWEPDGRRLATGSADDTVKVWNATTGCEVVTLRGDFHTVTSLSWGPDGRLASGCDDGRVKVWNTNRDQESSVMPGHGVRATSVSWSPNGKRLASADNDGKVRIWDPATRQEVLALKGHDKSRVSREFGLIRSLAWSPDGTHLASAGLDGRALVWEVAGGRKILALPTDHGSVWSVAWSPDGTRLAAGSADGTIRVVEGLQHTPKVRVFKAHQGAARALAWSPHGYCLASGGADNLVKLWGPIRGAELARMEGHKSSVLAVAWSPDGKRLASASADRLVMAWDAQTGRKLATMPGHNGSVGAVVWSPDGTRLASAGLDNSVRVWDPRTGAETFVLRGNSGMFHDVSWNTDGAQLAAASSDGQVWIWDATRGFERDTTPRALPYIDRKVAAGTARGGDLLWYAESYRRAGKPREALIAVKDDPYALGKLAGHFDHQNNAPLADAARAKARALLEQQLAAERDNPAAAADLADLLLIDRRARWTVLKPTEMNSEGGATLTLHDDGSILAEGGNREAESDTLLVGANVGIVKALKIETSTHESPPQDGSPFFNEYQILTTSSPALAAGVITGRYVRIDLPGDNKQFPRLPRDGDSKVLNLAELQVFQGDRNIALRKSARQSSTWEDWVAERAVDGRTSGGFDTIAHTDAVKDGNNPWWEVDLGGEQKIDRMVIWNRTDADTDLRMRHFRIRVLDTSRRVVFERFFVKPPEPSREIRFRAFVTTSEADGNRRLALRLLRNPRHDRTVRFRVSVTSDPQDLSWEDKRADVVTISNPWAKLAAAYQSAGRTREAVPYLAKVSLANPKDTRLSLKVAALQAWFGQARELAATRRRILAFARGTNDVLTAERAARACSIRASTDKAELEAALALGRTAVKVDKDGMWNLLALGMAEYRSGHAAAADVALLAAAKAGPNNPIATGISAFYRAMSLFRQGKPDDACKLGIAAAAKMKPLPKGERNPLANNASYDDLILWLAYKEAKAMIKFDAAPPKAEGDKK